MHASPKKSLGQHWLHDPLVLQVIVDLAELSDSQKVIEVGPGTGKLTQVLARSGAEVTALEYDKDLISKLQKQFDSQNVMVLHADIRTFHFGTFDEYKLVANIPYYLSANLARRLIDEPNKPSIAVLLVQKEVAERWAATDKGSLIATLLQVLYEVSLDIIVPPELFTPPPKVDSQVVVLRRRRNKLIDSRLWPVFVQVVKAGYSAPRKKLRSALSGGLRIDKKSAETLLAEAMIDPGKRAQELSITHWEALARVYARVK